MDKTLPSKTPKYTLTVDGATTTKSSSDVVQSCSLAVLHGPDRDSVYAELCEAVDEHIAIAAEKRVPFPPPLAGRKFSGKFILRTTAELHRDPAIRAHHVGNSLNNFIVKQLQMR